MRNMLLVAVGLVGAGLSGPIRAADAPPPELYRVIDVETKLNVRAEAAADAAVVGSIAPGATDVEIVAVDATSQWGRVNVGEGSGWVSLRYLETQGSLWEANALPAGLRCFGTEPFWDLRHDGSTLIRGGAGETDRPLAIDSVTGAAGSASRVVVARDKDGTLTLGIAQEQCSDGMSDRAFGLGARVSEGDAPALIGCCTVAPR